MKAKEVRATFSFTKNLGNFQSIRVEATVVAELEPKDTPEKAFRECWALVKE